MYLKTQNSSEYLIRLKAFIMASEADKSNKSKSAICYQCVDCENVTKFSSSMDVYAHLII